MYRETKGVPITELAGGIVADDKDSGYEAYDHDYSTGDFAYPDGRSVVEVGPRKTMLVRLSDVRELPQIREVIKDKEVEDLAHAIIADNDALQRAQTPEEISVALDLMHPPELLMLQPNELQVFLTDHADFYELETPIAIPHDNLPVMLQNAGHRRKRAIEHIIVKMKGLTLEDVAVRCNVHEGMTFAQANRRQAKENSHVQTSAIDDARNIIRQYKFIQRREGRSPSYAEIAKIYGFSESKVSTALAFDSLPLAVQALVGNEKGESQLSLNMLADLAPLRDLYDERYRGRMHDDPEHYSPETREARVADETERFAVALADLRKEGKSHKALLEKLNGEKTSVQKGLSIPIDELMLFEVQRPQAIPRKKEVYRRFGRNCLYGAELAAKNGAFEASDIERLEELVRIAKSLAEPHSFDNQETMF